MNKKMILFAIAFITGTWYASDSANSSLPLSMNFQPIPQNQVRTISEPVKILKIELASNTVVISNSKIDTFVVNPQTIDLKQFQVGTKVIATIKVTNTIDKLTLSNTSRTQLIKLQK